MRNRSIIINNPNNVTNIHWIANKMTHSKKVKILSRVNLRLKEGRNIVGL